MTDNRPHLECFGAPAGQDKMTAGNTERMLLEVCQVLRQDMNATPEGQRRAQEFINENYAAQHPPLGGPLRLGQNIGEAVSNAFNGRHVEFGDIFEQVFQAPTNPRTVAQQVEDATQWLRHQRNPQATREPVRPTDTPPQRTYSTGPRILNEMGLERPRVTRQQVHR